MRTIKRYANRKLYDTAEKRYLTLAHLSHLVSKGEKIRVLDNDSGEDITNLVLSKAISGKEKESGGFLPTELLSNLLQGGPNQILEYLKRSWKVGAEYLQDVESELDRRLKGYIDRGKLTSREALKFKDSMLGGLKERWADLEASVEKRLSGALGVIPIASRKDVERLEKRLELLVGRIESLDQAPESGRSTGRKPARRAATSRKAAAKKAPAKARKAPAKKKATARKAPAKARAKTTRPARKPKK